MDHPSLKLTATAFIQRRRLAIRLCDFPTPGHNGLECADSLETDMGARRPAHATTQYQLLDDYGIDYVTNSWYRFASLLQEGRLPETILQAERGVASCGCGS